MLEALEARTLLTADLTEIMSTGTLTLGGGDRTLIEIGGPEAGNPAGGNDIDGFDQIQVTNNATLGGTLEVKLVNDYVPDVGTTFDFLTVGGTRSGAFAHAEGLFSFPDGDRYFEIATNGQGLQLEVKAAPGGLSYIPPDAASKNGFGEFLSDYFSVTTANYTGALSVSGFAGFTGALSFAESDEEVSVVGTHVAASMTANDFTVGVTDGELGLVVTAEGKLALEAAGTLSLSGGGFESGTATATVVAVRYNETGAAYTGQTVTAGSLSYEFSNLPAATDLQEITVQGLAARYADYADIQGDFSFQQEQTVAGTVTTTEVTVG